MSKFDAVKLPDWRPEAAGKASMAPEGVAAVRNHAGTIGRVVESQRWWRRAFFATLPVLAVLGGANAWLAISREPVEVFGIPYDRDGRIEDVIRGGDFSPDARIIGQRLADWIIWVRVVSPDRTLMGKGIQKALLMMTERGRNMLKEIYSRDPDGLPMEWHESKARTVDDVEVTEESPDTFTVSWQETVYSHSTAVSSQRFRGTIVVRRISPKDDPKAFLDNPLGAFIDTVSWQAVGERE